MRNQGQILIGSLIILLGAALLAGQLLDVNIWTFCWPLGLIFLGVWLILRPRWVSPGTGVNLRPFGDVKRYGSWQVADEEIWMFVGDIHLDLVHASLPPGETIIRIFGFVGDVNLIVPQGLEFSVSSTAFLTDAKILQEKRDSFLSPVYFTSPAYQTAERKIRLEITFFIADLDVEQVSI